MANNKAKFLQNVPGAFYVDDQCIACDACVVEAPRFFTMNHQEGHAYVSLQPSTVEEVKNCIEALEACPVEAIGRDGKS
jgi:ferredoxin